MVFDWIKFRTFQHIFLCAKIKSSQTEGSHKVISPLAELVFFDCLI